MQVQYPGRVDPTVIRKILGLQQPTFVAHPSSLHKLWLSQSRNVQYELAVGVQ